MDAAAFARASCHTGCVPGHSKITGGGVSSTPGQCAQSKAAELTACLTEGVQPGTLLPTRLAHPSMMPMRNRLKLTRVPKAGTNLDHAPTWPAGVTLAMYAASPGRPCPSWAGCERAVSLADLAPRTASWTVRFHALGPTGVLGLSPMSWACCGIGPATDVGGGWAGIILPAMVYVVSR